MTNFASSPADNKTALSAVPEPGHPPMRDFDQFYREHRDEIGRALVFTLRDRSLGQEAVDEAMTKAYQRWNTLADTSNPAGWVYVVGLRWALSWRRGRRRERKRELLMTTTQTNTIEAPKAEHVDLMDALGELPIDQRTVVVCRFSLGLSTRQTAEALNIREGTVKSRLARAIERLRELNPDALGPDES